MNFFTRHVFKRCKETGKKTYEVETNIPAEKEVAEVIKNMGMAEPNARELRAQGKIRCPWCDFIRHAPKIAERIENRELDAGAEICEECVERARERSGREKLDKEMRDEISLLNAKIASQEAVVELAKSDALEAMGDLKRSKEATGKVMDDLESIVAIDICQQNIPGLISDDKAREVRMMLAGQALNRLQAIDRGE